MKTTVLVTGAGGFVGLATVKSLLAAGHAVRAFELRGSPHLKDLYALAGESDSLTVIEGDITVLDDVRDAVGDATHIVHSAALLNSIANRETFEAVNLNGTVNAIQAACENNVERFLLVSTSDVFGIPERDEVIDETTAYREWGEPYADTKIAACRALKDAHQRTGLNYTIIYPGWVYGPGDRQFFPAITDMLGDRHVFLWHRYDPYKVDFIFIDDLVSAVTSALFSSHAANQDFLILNEDSEHTPELIFRWMAHYLGLEIKLHKVPYQLMMLIARISQWLTRKGITSTHLLSTTDVKAFGNDFRFTAAKAKALLDWQPTVNEVEGFKRYFTWAGISQAVKVQKIGHKESC